MSSEHWVTINGVHVLIGGNGTISKGPANLVGKTIEEVKGEQAPPKAEPEETNTASHGVNGTDLLPDFDNMSLGEAFSELEKLGINSIEDAIKYQGFSGIPTVMSAKDFDEYVSNGGIELSRGISASSKDESDQYVNALKYGDFYVAGGEAYFGQGMYAFGGKSLDEAGRYARGRSGTVISMALPKDAKVLEIKGKRGLRNPEVDKAFYNEIDTVDNYGRPTKGLHYNKNNRLQQSIDLLEGMGDTAEFLKKQGYKLPQEPDIDLIYTDIGKYQSMQAKYNSSIATSAMDYLRKTLPKEDVKLLADYTKSSGGNNIITACRGYDAIRLSPEYVDGNSSNGSNEIWIVLNRSKLVVKE